MAPGGLIVRVPAAMGDEIKVASDNNQRREARPSLQSGVRVIQKIMSRRLVFELSRHLDTTLSEKNPPAKTPKEPPPMEAPRIQ